MSNLIIGAIDKLSWTHIKYWCNSIKTGYADRKVIVALNIDGTTNKILQENGFEVFHAGVYDDYLDEWKYTPKLTVHVERFVHIWDFLRRQIDIDSVVMTDVRDVVFQKNPFEGNSGYFRDRLIVGSECMKYVDEPWGSENLLNTFGPHFWSLYKHKTIYNVGVVGGSFNLVRDMALMIYQMSLGRPIPIVDQAVFNFLLWQEPWASVTKFCQMEDSWAIHCGTVADPRKPEFIPKLLESAAGVGFSKVPGNEHIVITGKCKTDGHEMQPDILHQWDRNPKFKQMVERVYG